MLDGTVPLLPHPRKERKQHFLNRSATNKGRRRLQHLQCQDNWVRRLNKKAFARSRSKYGSLYQSNMLLLTAADDCEGRPLWCLLVDL